jgi:hypothetical protein
MSENFKEMFADSENQEATAGARSLGGTAQLTSLSTTVVNQIMAEIDKDIDTYRERLAASKADHNVMDALVKEIAVIEPEQTEFLKAIDSVTLEAMLKSQQSKRSRTKGKAMTMDNYRAMMTGAVAEHLLREALGKEKSAMGARRTSGQIVYTEEELEAYAADQELLKKELRNVQSKKSIFKSKGELDETDEHWQQLLTAEAQLKERRVGTDKTVEVDTTKNALTDLLGEIDPSSLKAGDSKELLAKIKELVG